MICQVAASASEWSSVHSLTLAATEKSSVQRTFVSLFFLLSLSAFAAFATTAQPNILWVSREDRGPQLNYSGDTYATTPNIDRLASRAQR